jgi:hypothetical protein
MVIFIKWLFNRWTLEERFRIEHNGLYDEHKVYRVMERNRWRGWCQRNFYQEDLESAEQALDDCKSERIIEKAKFVPVTNQHRVEQALEKAK